MRWTIDPRFVAIRLVLGGILATGVGCAGGTGTNQASGAGGGLLPDQELSFDLGSCDVTIAGARSVSYQTPGGPLTFASDYWLTDAQVRDLLEAEAALDEMIAPEDVPRVVDLGMSRDPRYFPMAMFCLGPDAGVSLVPGSQSRYADVPFRSNAYEIAPVGRADEAIAGNFAALVSLFENGENVEYVVTEPGELIVEQFHRSRISGSFAFQAAGPDGTEAIDVSGRFEFRRPAMPADDES